MRSRNPLIWLLNFSSDEETGSQSPGLPGGLLSLNQGMVPKAAKTQTHESENIKLLQRGNKRQGLTYLFFSWLFLKSWSYYLASLSLLPHNTAGSWTTPWWSVYFPYFNKYVQVLSMTLCTLQISTCLKLYCTSSIAFLPTQWFIQIWYHQPSGLGLCSVSVE